MIIRIQIIWIVRQKDASTLTASFRFYNEYWAVSRAFVYECVFKLSEFRW